MRDPQLIGDLKQDEGRSGRSTPAGFIHVAYPDPLSPLAAWLRAAKGRTLASPTRPRGLSGAPWTIGYGHTGRDVVEGLEWTEAQATAALERDVDAHNMFLDRVLPWISGLDPVRRRVLYNMHFNMGWDDPKTIRLEGLAAFMNTLGAIRRGDYGAGADGMKASLWARQTGTRATRLIQEMRTGRYALTGA